jgi:hypothetical protein
MIEEILDGAPTFSKYDLTIREMVIRTDPTNESSRVIKRKFKPLDNHPTFSTSYKGFSSSRRA